MSLRELSKSFDWGDVLIATGLLPMMLVDGQAGLLAEMAVQLVFGTLIARRLLRPRAQDEAFLHIVGKTWAARLLLVLLSAVLGWALRDVQPGAVSVGDLLR